MKFYSARQAIHDAYAIHLTSKGFEVNPLASRMGSHSIKQENDLLICNAVAAGKIIAAVEKLDEPFRSWAKWVYGPRTEHFMPEQGRFFKWLEQDVTKQLAKVSGITERLPSNGLGMWWPIQLWIIVVI